MKSKDKKEDPTEFQESSVDADFAKLMERYRVRRLKTPEKKKRKSPRRAKASDPVTFDCEPSIPADALPPKPEGKFERASLTIRYSIQRKRRKIAPGFVPDAEIDLHGLVRDEAIQKTAAFMDRCRKSKCKTVLIITGRGLNSGEEKGILRKTVWNWLKNHQKHYNINYKWAPEFLGGKGAILVFFN